MADRVERRRSRRSRSHSSDDNVERKSRRSSASSSKHKTSRNYSKKSRSRSRSSSSNSDSDHKSKRRQRTRSSSSSSSSSSADDRKSHNKKGKSPRKRKRSCSRSSSSSSSDSNDSDSEYKRKKAKKSKHKKPTKMKKKKKKTTKKKEKKTKHAVNQSKYGKYGLLTEADQFTKQPEFFCWIQEVKQVNPETVPRLETKKLFEDYMEDYNTATFPHKKYYNLAKWEMKQDEKKKLKALKKAQKNTISFADDESNHTKKFRGEEKRYGLSKQKIMEMKRAMKERSVQEYKKNVGF